MIKPVLHTDAQKVSDREKKLYKGKVMCRGRGFFFFLYPCKFYIFLYFREKVNISVSLLYQGCLYRKQSKKKILKLEA